MTSSPLLRLFLAAALLAVAGCGDVNVDPGPRYPPRGVAVGGDLQGDTVTDDLPAALVVRVTDQAGEPIAGQTVTWTVTAGGGSVFAATSQTNAAGEATNRWRLGPVARDTQRVEARMIDPGSSAAVVLTTFRAVGLPDVPAAIAARAPAARTGSAGQALADSLEALVTDAHGNAVPGVVVIWSAPASDGSLSPGAGFTDAAGIARAEWTLGLSVGAQQTAEAAISPAVRTAFTAVAGVPVAAALVKVSGDAQTGTVGAALLPLRVQLRTSLGLPIGGAQVTWTPAAFSGTVIPPVSVTGADGYASTTWTLATTPGMQQVTATVQGTADAVFAATGEAGPPVLVTVVPAEVTMTAELDTVRLRATVLDTYGNAAGAAVQWASLEPAVATVDGAGLVTSRDNGTARVTATAGGKADTALVTVRQQAVRLVFAPAADTLNAIGDTAAFTVQLQDRNDRPIDGTNFSWTYDASVLGMPRPGVVVSRTVGTTTVLARAGGFEKGVTVLSRQVPATVQLRGGDTLIVHDTVPLPVVAVRDSNGVDIAAADRPAATAGAAGAVSLVNGQVYASAPGTGTVTVAYAPASAVAQVTVIAFDSVAAGAHHACGRTTGGAVYCWGAGFNVAGAPVGRPRRVALPAPAMAVSAECALVQGGTVYCGLAGTPAAWTGVPPIVALSEGCGLTAAGAAYCRDRNGVVSAVPGGHTFAQVSERYSGADDRPVQRCGLKADGTAWCWLAGDAPAALPGGQTFRRIAVGEWLSCGIATDGRLLCWGELYGGSTPVVVSASLALVSLDAGYADACGLRADGALYCWGSGATSWQDYSAGPPSGPVAKWSALRFTDYDVGWPVRTSLNTQAPLHCGSAGGAPWCDGGDQYGTPPTGRTGGNGGAGPVLSPM